MKQNILTSLNFLFWPLYSADQCDWCIVMQIERSAECISNSALHLHYIGVEMRRWWDAMQCITYKVHLLSWDEATVTPGFEGDPYAVTPWTWERCPRGFPIQMTQHLSKRGKHWFYDNIMGFLKFQVRNVMVSKNVFVFLPKRGKHEKGRFVEGFWGASKWAQYPFSGYYVCISLL